VPCAFGSVDIVVANAGLPKDSAFAEMTLHDWQIVLSTNLTGQFLTSQAAVKEFRRRGPTSGSKALGKIICMSSVHEVIPWAGRQLRGVERRHPNVHEIARAGSRARAHSCELNSARCDPHADQ
jgi:NAD(P)-dependent dehydrogenase (short-subunit alcohol dehydrogenase family)